MFQFAHCPPSLPMCSAGGLQTSLWRGCPIRNLRVLRLHAAPPERFAGLRVLLRSFAPRHPPRTLCSLFVSHLHLVFFVCLVFLDDSLLQLVLQFSLSKIEGIVVRLFRCMVWGATPNLWRVEISLVAGLVLRVKAGSCSTWEWISRKRSVFPRKEVIQPHLPVRLPCYDFTPITDPTLDACLSCELAQRLQVLPTFVV